MYVHDRAKMKGPTLDASRRQEPNTLLSEKERPDDGYDISFVVFMHLLGYARLHTARLKSAPVHHRHRKLCDRDHHHYWQSIDTGWGILSQLTSGENAMLSAIASSTCQSTC